MRSVWLKQSYLHFIDFCPYPLVIGGRWTCWIESVFAIDILFNKMQFWCWHRFTATKDGCQDVNFQNINSLMWGLIGRKIRYIDSDRCSYDEKFPSFVDKIAIVIHFHMKLVPYKFTNDKCPCGIDLECFSVFVWLFVHRILLVYVCHILVNINIKAAQHKVTPYKKKLLILQVVFFFWKPHCAWMLIDLLRIQIHIYVYKYIVNNQQTLVING